MANQRARRRLAAVIAVDMVGYSRLIEADEPGTIRRQKALHEAVFAPLLAEHDGRIVKTTGDGLLAEFASAVDAVDCAAAMQTGIADYQAKLSDSPRLEFRIGVNVGDIVADGDDILGDGVIVATRLEGFAPPGGICVSSVVRDQVAGKIEYDFKDRGEQTLKNAARPVHVFELDMGNAVAGPNGGADFDSPAIAVLPFANMSGDAEQEYFADGLTEDIITALSHLRSMPVIARNSSFVFKGKNVRVEEAARELGVRYVLEGSVRKAANRVRVTAQLIDGRTGHHVWAERYDRALEDVFEIQDDITLRIALALQIEIEAAELRRGRSARPENLSAWDLYLRGMAEVSKETCQGNAAARDFFEQAIDLAPGYGEAWSGIAWSHLRDYSFQCTEDPGESLRLGIDAAVRAVELDDASAFTHYVLSTAYIWNEEITKSLAELERVLTINPYFARAHFALGNRLDLAGRSEEGIAAMKRALELSPRDPEVHFYMSFLSRALAVQGAYDESLHWAEQAASLRPNNADMQYRMAVVLAHLDRVEEARAALESCERIRPGYTETRKNWRPYPDDAKNDAYFAGMMRHGLR